jgi:hypothetical protein
MLNRNEFRAIAPRASPVEARRDGLARPVLALLLTVAAAAGAGIAGYLWLVAGPGFSPMVEAVTGRRDAAQSVSLPVSEAERAEWTDADIRRCAAEARAAEETASRRRLAAVSADRVGLGGPDAAMVKRATHLLCTAETKPLHLCQRYWRDDFVEALKAYVADYRKASTSAYWTKVNIAQRAKEASARQQAAYQALSEDLDQTTREVMQMHDEIVAAFRKLIADGIIRPDAFGVLLGVGIPPDIENMIGDARPTREACSYPG